ncbi:S-layer homology domain-containing protein [Peribacillus saganii]|uniref:S-layer homology domain-containing protein n=1 Tax=Peribacillus saganii TaxID=2303992 RepID=A0A372LPA8_9BACI|nr:S-layer homology domain-containing protein [Peribacillus saganii]RFU68320.1 S-layer homology domain-containing protein [Peribacillus saganii]
MKKTAYLLMLTLFLVGLPVINASAEPMVDVQDHWAKNEINALQERGIISGFEDGTFRPYAQVTRGQFVAFLVRALELPKGDSAFRDVPKTSKLYNDISAAKKAGLIMGTVEGYAKADEKITRTDAAALLDRAVQHEGDYPEKAQLVYTDARLISKYAYESVQRMTYYKLISGTQDNKFQPLKIANRGESAALIYRMLSFIGKLEGSTPVKPATSNPSITSLDLGDGNKVQIRLNTAGLPLQYIRQDSVTHIRATDKNYYYHIGSAQNSEGTLKVTLRKLDNSDTFIYTQFQNKGNSAHSASIILPFANATSYDVSRIDSYGMVDRKHNDTFGIDPSSHPIGLLSVKNGDQPAGNVMMGKNYISLKREHSYPNGQKSVLREFLEEYESYKILQNKESASMSMELDMKVPANAVSESWALLSNQQLFESKENKDHWFKRSIEEYTTINSWLTAEGAYTKLPWSVEPGYKMAFGRNLGNMQGGIYLEEFQGLKERYFYDLVLNSVADLNIFSNGALRTGNVPVFKTEYTSTWLKKEYGTTAPYIDTRHNENTALFLKHTGEEFGIEQLAAANRKYADFLVQQKSVGNIIQVTPSSHLIADYYAPGSEKTHVSLNHALGEMRFLIETYQQTKEEKYHKTAREIQTAIEFLHPRWIREDGDLWYQVNGRMEFNGRDYPWLTLADLLLSQERFEEIGQARSKVFDEMIRSKTKYLVDTKQPIKGEIVQMLRDQGFGDLVEGYGSVRTADALEKDTLDLLAE